MVEMRLSRIVIREDSDRQFIFVTESGGQRGFPIVIGTAEAIEIHRVIQGQPSERPLTHQLAHTILSELGGQIRACEIVDLRQNTFFAVLAIRAENGRDLRIDARPSDAIALALRAGGKVFVNESVLEQVRTDESGPDPLPDPD